MKCISCHCDLPDEARFCFNCGNKVVPESTVQVNQEVESIAGSMVGSVLGSAAYSRFSSTTDQRIHIIEVGGTVVGTVLSDAQQTNIGGAYMHGNTIQGDVISGDKFAVEAITDSSGIVLGRDSSSIVSGVSVGNKDDRGGKTDKDQMYLSNTEQFDTRANEHNDVLSIKTILMHIAQHIAALPSINESTKTELQSELMHLSAELQKIPVAQVDEPDV